MANDLIHDRGRGPEIVGTRITVYNLLADFLDPTATEAYICGMYDLTPEQVAAARAYVLNNPETVLARHLEIEARMAAGNPPAVIERAKQTHATFLSFKDWLVKRQRAEAQENAAESAPEPAKPVLPTSRRSANGLQNKLLGRGHDMRGRLADMNVQGHLPYLRQLLETLDLWSVLTELNLKFATFTDLQIPRNLDDRSLWNRGQQEDWVLFTENRNHEDPNSLHATTTDSWRAGHLPVLTLANKGRFEHDAGYAKRVATDVAELLFGIAQGEYRDQPRIFVPR